VPEAFFIRGREEYDRRKKVKQNFYRGAGAPLFEWEVGQPMPDLDPWIYCGSTN
jgi:hypothetical protein